MCNFARVQFISRQVDKGYFLFSRQLEHAEAE